MMKQPIGICLAALLFSSSLISSLAYPNSHPRPEYKKSLDATQQHQQQLSERKFAEKSNSIKKVALDDLDDVQTNEISQTGTAGGGFSWSNLLGMVMQMIFNPGGAAATGPNKSEGLDESGVVPTSPWANLLSMGLKILSAILGGGVGAQTDGIDKVDNGGSPLQFINIVVNLLDALKTSFSHRSLAARNIGRKDSVSEAAVAGITMAKGYVRSLGTNESTCMAKYMCQANNECSTDIGRSSLFCNLGSYAASFVLDKSTSKTTFDLLYEAGRRGRSGENCEMGYLECNEIY
ncbi:uncharacterized protein LOC126738841 isoform X3 [Anthonomus grandis grandis]|uniref:uncharacterized protein LOC126738841 isoform X3 n=1 Tax=Anthonomus grandis grandis TaxID=2921223 RepID=UPI002165B16D|nr:uncharacterized protein LOC126738841 isoform X3 [Anthonomus grandis grandis]